MTGLTDLDQLIASMRPRLDPDTYVWVTGAGQELAAGAVVTVTEDEGLTAVVTRERAATAGVASTFPCRRITLQVHSALEAVGLTAAFTTALTTAGISANVVAGFHHDHVFVTADRAEEAMAALIAMAQPGSPSGAR